MTAVAALLPGCSGSGDAPGGGVSSGDVELIGFSFGRLVDVYGYVRDGSEQQMVLFQTDVIIGTDIEDERPTGSDLPDGAILYDFLAANPDNLQPRLLIPREIGGPEFEAAWNRLDLRLTEVAPANFGQDTGALPFPVVARNAAIQLSFSEPLPVEQSFFIEQSPEPGVFDVKNNTAVQLLAIRGDPRDSSPTGDFEQIPARVIVRGDKIILDPVLLGIEGSRYRLRNNASGLPASPNQDSANLRIALALEGPLRMPGLREPRPSLIGTNNAGDLSIIRDFRSGNALDDSAAIKRGFVRDAEPPRIIGEMLMYLSSVERVNAATQLVTIYKGGIEHEIDVGDLFRFVDRTSGNTIGITDVIEKPEEDLGDPSVQWVSVLVRRLDALDAAGDGGDRVHDPSDDLGYPLDLEERKSWLLRNAPQAVLVAEFTASRRHPTSGASYGDDPAHFLSFAPRPQPASDGVASPPNQNVSPFAEAVIRFSKPVDLDTVRAFDSFFFATRNVLDDEVIEQEFLSPNGIDPERFDKDKFRTPHLVASRIVDTDGSQTVMRLQPTKGFFLNEEMRRVDEGVPFEDKRFRYFMHLLGGTSGVKDLAGNELDFRATGDVIDFLAIPFSLDTRKGTSQRPRFADNLAVSIVRRFAGPDEDEQPSLYRAEERNGADPATGLPSPARPEAYPLQDLFGGVTYLSGGRLRARETARVRKIVDNLNQQPAPPRDSDFKFCPDDYTQGTAGNPTATVAFSHGIQNPLNPYGARLQTVWREIDLSLSRIDPSDFNLDVERMYWAPFRGSPITFDHFDRTSLFLGHSEQRPEPCIGLGSAMPELPWSGLIGDFGLNYAHDRGIDGRTQAGPPPHPAYQDQALTIDASQTIFEPNGVNRFLPLPEFQKPYFVWRDETVTVQGGESKAGSDTNQGPFAFSPYIISPWLGGNGRFVTQTVPGTPFDYNFGGHQNQRNTVLGVDSRVAAPEAVTGGGCPTIALPLLADFWTYCDDPSLPEGNGFIASGYNGWQIALAAQSSPRPNFRAYSGGFSGSASRQAICVNEGTSAWTEAQGGYRSDGQPTADFADNSVYWMMADFVKRQTVVTAGFVDILNPHRMPDRQLDEGDPRLGPYLLDGSGQSALPSGVLPRYSWMSEPSLERLPAGTAVVPEFRAASRLDPEPWRFHYQGQERLEWSEAPNEINFPLDPLKACDAGIRKYDERIHPDTGRKRRWWAYYYNRHVTDYTRNTEDLRSSGFTSRFTNLDERFNASDVRYFNWRLIMRNNVSANPAVSPELDSFAVTYRFEAE